MAKKKGLTTELSQLEKDILRAVSAGKEVVEKSESNGRRISVAFTDPFSIPTGPMTKGEIKAKEQAIANSNPLIKSVLNVLNGPGDSIERLAFEQDPTVTNNYQSLWKRKIRLLPDELLKRISIQDDLVAAIVNTRSNHVAAFGRPQPDRFSTGFRIEPEPGYTEHLSSDEKEKLQARIAKAEAKILTCGETRGWSDHEALDFGQFLFMSARNAVVFGRIATEAIYTDTPDGKKFHSFRPMDAGTIFRAAPYKEAAQAVRDSALHMLEQVRNKKLKPERYINDEYAYVQVIQGTMRQVFTPEECLVHNFYPTTDVELDGYPVTPLDTVISAVTTHINIGTHNKLYFQNGRAARGMIVIKSDDITPSVTDTVRQQFNASINSVGSSWRMPVFGVGSDDDIGWYPIDNSSRDMEFQYLSDSNARTILSAFQISPEELPGYSHLSRGTNSQALSEGNGEYKLEAARDVGIRPLLANFQNFVNSRILPLIDEELSTFCYFKFVGLDAESEEKEGIRLQQDSQVHMNYDEILEKVQKKPVGNRFGGKYPLNPQWQAVMDKFVTVGVQLEHFFGVENASKDPRYDYLNNPLWFQWQQMQMEQQQMQMQQQQMQQQQQMAAQQQQQQGQGGDLTQSVNQLQQTLSKGEMQLPDSKRKLLYHQKKVVENVMKGLEDDSKKLIKDILDTADSLLPTKLKE